MASSCVQSRMDSNGSREGLRRPALSIEPRALAIPLLVVPVCTGTDRNSCRRGIDESRCARNLAASCPEGDEIKHFSNFEEGDHLNLSVSSHGSSAVFSGTTGRPFPSFSAHLSAQEEVRVGVCPGSFSEPKFRQHVSRCASSHATQASLTPPHCIVVQNQERSLEQQSIVGCGAVFDQSDCWNAISNYQSEQAKFDFAPPRAIAANPSALLCSTACHQAFECSAEGAAAQHPNSGATSKSNILHRQSSCRQINSGDGTGVESGGHRMQRRSVPSCNRLVESKHKLVSNLPTGSSSCPKSGPSDPQCRVIGRGSARKQAAPTQFKKASGTMRKSSVASCQSRKIESMKKEEQLIPHSEQLPSISRAASSGVKRPSATLALNGRGRGRGVDQHKAKEVSDRKTGANQKNCGPRSGDNAARGRYNPSMQRACGSRSSSRDLRFDETADRWQVGDSSCPDDSATVTRAVRRYLDKMFTRIEFQSEVIVRKQSDFRDLFVMNTTRSSHSTKDTGTQHLLTNERNGVVMEGKDTRPTKEQTFALLNKNTVGFSVSPKKDRNNDKSLIAGHERYSGDNLFCNSDTKRHERCGKQQNASAYHDDNDNPSTPTTAMHQTDLLGCCSCGLSICACCELADNIFVKQSNIYGVVSIEQDPLHWRDYLFLRDSRGQRQTTQPSPRTQAVMTICHHEHMSG
eukprot:Selendium_serpulae@DN6036_c0_g1_i2.p1